MLIYLVTELGNAWSKKSEYSKKNEWIQNYNGISALISQLQQSAYTANGWGYEGLELPWKPTSLDWHLLKTPPQKTVQNSLSGHSCLSQR